MIQYDKEKSVTGIRIYKSRLIEVEVRRRNSNPMQIAKGLTDRRRLYERYKNSIYNE